MTAKETFSLKILYETDKKVKKEFDSKYPDVVKFLNSCKDEFGFEIALLPESIRELEAKLVEAEEKNDRKSCIKITQQIISNNQIVDFPILYAFTQLKLGTTLLVLSKDNFDFLNQAIVALKSAAEGLPEENFSKELIFAYYNLALAYTDERLFDWDNSDDNWSDVIKYGEKAVDLIAKNPVSTRINILALMEKLALAYQSINVNNKEDILDKAIFYWNQILDFTNELDSSNKNATCLQVYANLAKIYRTRERNGKNENEELSQKYLKKYDEYSRKL